MSISENESFKSLSMLSKLSFINNSDLTSSEMSWLVLFGIILIEEMYGRMKPVAYLINPHWCVV